MLPTLLGTLPTKRATPLLLSSFHISQYLHTDHGTFLLFHSNNVHPNDFVLRKLHLFSLMDAYVGYPLSEYGGIF